MIDGISQASRDGGGAPQAPWRTIGGAGSGVGAHGSAIITSRLDSTAAGPRGTQDKMLHRHAESLAWVGDLGPSLWTLGAVTVSAGTHSGGVGAEW